MGNNSVNANNTFCIDELYKSILNNEKNVEDLNNDEIDILISYLKSRIKRKEKEMNIIKKRILNIKSKI